MITYPGKNQKLQCRAVTAAFVFVSGLVLINTLSPLRLNNDAGRYLGIVEYFKGTLGPNSDAAHDFLPHGYPYFLYILDRIGLLSPFSITLFNILAITGASVILMRELRIGDRLFYLTLVLICYINIKEYAIPVSDQLFTFLFVGSILLWSRTFKGNLYFLLPALLMTALSIYVRTAGIAILIGVIAYLVYLKREHFRKRKILLGTALVLLGAFVVIFIINLNFIAKKVDYVRQLNLAELANPVNLAGRLAIHLKEMGEIIINMPVSKLSPITDRPHLQIAPVVLIIVGVLSLWVYFKSVKKLRLVNTFVFWASAAYLLMIFAWPFYDGRFLIPVIPLLVFLYWYYLYNLLKSPFLRGFLLIVYIGMGMVSLLYSDALSVSKPFFLNHYGADPNLTEMYRDHFEREAKRTVKVFDIHKDYLPFMLEEYDRKPPFHFSR